MDDLGTFLKARAGALERIVGGGDVAETLDALCRDTEDIDPGMRCSILYYDQAAQCVRHAAAPSLPDYFTSAVDGLAVGPTAGCCGAAAYTGERVIVEYVLTHPNWEAFRDLARRAGIRACWSQPIYSSTKDVLGTFAMYFDEARRPTEDEIQLIQAQAHLASLAIERRQTEKMLSESEALRRSEQRLRTIFDVNPSGISIIALETNERLFTNQAFVRMFGAETIDQLSAVGFEATYVNPADFDWLRSRRGDAFITEVEVERLRRDGSRWWCLMNRREIEFESQQALLVWHYDITERKRAEQEIERLNSELELRVAQRTSELRKSQALFKAIVDHSPTKIHIKDTDGRYVLINREAERLFGVSDAEGRGKTAHDLFPKDTADRFTAHDQAVIDSGEPMVAEEAFTLDDGIHTYLTTKFPIYDQNGITAVGAIGTEITARKKAEAALEKSRQELALLSFTDALTGIANRRKFDDVLDTEWKRAQRNETPLSIIMMDIDFFKPFNDNYGHTAGDECLKILAKALSESLERPGDLVARYGGEEFVCIMPETDGDGARNVAEQLLEVVRGARIPHEFSSVADIVTMSLGCLTVVGRQDLTAEAIMRDADRLLYQSKNGGRNRITAESRDGERSKISA